MIPRALRQLIQAVSAKLDLSAASIGPWIVGILFALPTLIVHFPPMTDLPFHEGILGGMVHWGDDVLVPKAIYQLNFGHPNQLFYFLGYPLAKVLGTTWAVKIVVAGSQVATAVAAARLARYLGTPWWACQVVAASTIGWLYFWGLVANMLGLSVMLFALPAFDRFAREPNGRRAVGMAGWIALLYLAHESSLFCSAIAFAMFALLLPVRARRWHWYAAPVAAAGGMVLGHAILSWSLKSAAQVSDAGNVVFDAPWYRVLTIAQTIGGSYPPPIDWALVSLMLVPLVLGLVVRFAWSEPDKPRTEDTRFRRVRAWLDERRFAVVAGAFFVFYLAFPSDLLSATLLHQRFLLPAFALFATWVIPGSSPNPRGVRMVRLARLTATLALAGPLLTAWPAFQEADLAYRQLDAIVSTIAPGQAFFAQEMVPRRSSSLYTSATACGHVLALRGGRCAYDFTQSPIAPLLVKPNRIWNDSSTRLQSGSPHWPMPEWDFQRYRYMILWVPTYAAPFSEFAEGGVRPSARLVARNGQWFIFESTILREAIDSDEPTPKPPLPPSFAKLWREEARRYLRGHPE